MKRYTASIWENKYNQLINNGCCLVSIVAAVVLVGCGESQPPEPPTAKAPDISIHEAAEGGNIEAVKQHLAAGADVNAKEWQFGTPLHHATMGGHKKVAALLIAAGADVNAKNNVGSTPLHNVAFGGHKETAELLIARGSDVNAMDRRKWTPLTERPGLTPLDTAIGRKHPEIADLLRKHGGKTGAGLKAEGK